MSASRTTSNINSISDSYLGLLTHSLQQVEVNKDSHLLYQASLEWKHVYTCWNCFSCNDSSSETKRTTFVRVVRMMIERLLSNYYGMLSTSDHGMSLTGFISWSQSTNRIRRSREASQVHMSNNRLWQDDKYCHDRDSNNHYGLYKLLDLFFITDGSFIQITFGYLLQTFLILIKFQIISLCIVLALLQLESTFLILLFSSVREVCNIMQT